MSDYPLLSIQQATVRHLNHTLFKHLDFTLHKSENWALIGKSGSGKSSLLQTIAGKFNITRGEIRYHFFEDFLTNTAIKENALTHHQFISLVESKHHFRNLSNTTEFYYQQRYNSSDSEDAYTVEQYLQQIKPLYLDKLYWTISKVIRTFKLESLINKQVIKLSNGETKRLMLAAALIKNPVILLLDTPLSGFDVQTRATFNDILQEVAASGITIIMSTSPVEIPGVINQIAVLENGNITQIIPKANFKPSLYKYETVDYNAKDRLETLLLNNNNKSIYRFMVKMNGVTIKYGEKIILNAVNWEIVPGERWALLGPNGAGKSTLLSLINGDNPQAYANDIILFDRKRGTGESIWDIKSKIGFVSPELHQYFPADNSCLQVVESGYYDTIGLFRPSQRSKAESALSWMQALEIDQHGQTLLKNIPAGAQRLCLLARALIKNPDLLIFDEPCQGLDEHQLQHFKQVINAICERNNVTIIYVTHYPHEIPDSVTKILKLEKGMVVKNS